MMNSLEALIYLHMHRFVYESEAIELVKKQ